MCCMPGVDCFSRETHKLIFSLQPYSETSSKMETSAVYLFNLSFPLLSCFSQTKLNHLTILISTKKCNEPDNGEALILFSLSTLHLNLFHVSSAFLFPKNVSNIRVLVNISFSFTEIWKTSSFESWVESHPDNRPAVTTLQRSYPGHGMSFLGLGVRLDPVNPLSPSNPMGSS